MDRSGKKENLFEQRELFSFSVEELYFSYLLTAAAFFVYFFLLKKKSKSRAARALK